MKLHQVFVLVFIITSCSNDGLEPINQFPILDSRDVKFEYYYGNPDQWPVNVLDLKVVEGIELNGKLYSAFFDNNSNPKPTNIISDDLGMLAYNFLPIRYEDGNYYEYRGKDVLILKDNIKQGDSWIEIFHENEIETTYSFEVISIHSTFSEHGILYDDVYEIMETISFPDNGSDDFISHHYYNKEIGIIKRVVPAYQSGAYLETTFIRTK
jgi:hypothetical protein